MITTFVYLLAFLCAVQRDKLYDFKHSFREYQQLRRRNFFITLRIWREVAVNENPCRAKQYSGHFRLVRAKPVVGYDTARKKRFYEITWEFYQRRIPHSDRLNRLAVHCESFNISRQFYYLPLTRRRNPVLHFKDWKFTVALGEKFVFRPVLTRPTSFDARLTVRAHFGRVRKTLVFLIRRRKTEARAQWLDLSREKSLKKGALGRFYFSIAGNGSNRRHDKIIHWSWIAVNYGVVNAKDHFIFADGQKRNKLNFSGLLNKEFVLAQKGAQFGNRRAYRVYSNVPACLQVANAYIGPRSERFFDLHTYKNLPLTPFSVYLKSMACFKRKKEAIIYTEWFGPRHARMTDAIKLVNIRAPPIKTDLVFLNKVHRAFHAHTVYFAEIRFSRRPFSGFGDGLPDKKLALRVVPVDKNVQISAQEFLLRETAHFEEMYYQPSFLFAFVLNHARSTDLRFEVKADLSSKVSKDKVWMAVDSAVQKLSVEKKPIYFDVRCPRKAFPNSVFSCEVRVEFSAQEPGKKREFVLTAKTKHNGFTVLDAYSLVFTNNDPNPYSFRKFFRFRTGAKSGLFGVKFEKSGNAAVMPVEGSVLEQKVHVLSTGVLNNSVVIRNIAQLARPINYGGEVRVFFSRGKNVGDVRVVAEPEDPLVVVSAENTYIFKKQSTRSFKLSVQRGCELNDACFARSVKIKLKLETSAIKINEKTANVFTYESLVASKKELPYVGQPVSSFAPLSFFINIKGKGGPELAVKFDASVFAKKNALPTRSDSGTSGHKKKKVKGHYQHIKKHHTKRGKKHKKYDSYNEKELVIKNSKKNKNKNKNKKNKRKTKKTKKKKR